MGDKLILVHNSTIRDLYFESKIIKVEERNQYITVILGLFRDKRYHYDKHQVEVESILMPKLGPK